MHRGRGAGLSDYLNSALPLELCLALSLPPLFLVKGGLERRVRLSQLLLSACMRGTVMACSS